MPRDRRRVVRGTRHQCYVTFPRPSIVRHVIGFDPIGDGILWHEEYRPAPDQLVTLKDQHQAGEIADGGEVETADAFRAFKVLQSVDRLARLPLSAGQKAGVSGDPLVEDQVAKRRLFRSLLLCLAREPANILE